METTYFKHPLRFPKNVDGPFYTTGHQSRETDAPDSSMVWRGDCLWCGAPEAEAPTLFAPFDDTYKDTYFVRQPSTPEETEQAIMSAHVCCVSAVRYGGTDCEIISKLGNDPQVCDYIITDSGEMQCTVGSDGNLLPFAQSIVDARQPEIECQWKGQHKKWWQFWI
ncbi:MAG: ferredoxin [Planctomycetales bacterium]|nr:ferredoxin [Planctomycetales bacterium]